MSKYDKLIGTTIGRLKILRKVEMDSTSHLLVECECKCGNIITLLMCSIVKGNTTSCGCYRSELLSNKNKSHGLSKTKIYSIWKTMRQRCNNPKNKDYSYYGGRGINICKEWDEFINFYSDMNNDYENHISKFGKYGTTIDRIDVNGNYSINNCKWATWKEQQNNKRQSRGN